MKCLTSGMGTCDPYISLAGDMGVVGSFATCRLCRTRARLVEGVGSRPVFPAHDSPVPTGQSPTAVECRHELGWCCYYPECAEFAAASVLRAAVRELNDRAHHVEAPEAARLTLLASELLDVAEEMEGVTTWTRPTTR